MFTLKLYHDGVVTENPKGYAGGGFSYIDRCNVNMISLIEIISMLKEFGCSVLYYKLPSTDFEIGLWVLENDGDIMELCELVSIQTPSRRLLYVFSVTHSLFLELVYIQTPRGLVMH